MRSEQEDLFSFKPQVEPPYQRHSQTSKAAAQSIKKSVGPLHRRILDYLAVHSAGATDEALIEALEIGPSTLRPRRIELVSLGLVVDSGATALTKSRRSAVVWRLCK